MIRVSKTFIPDMNKYLQMVSRILESGWLTNDGIYVNELEKRLSEYLGVRNLLLVSSGTTALIMAYKLLELKGDVITTPFSFAATTSSQVWSGLNPVYIDIDENTFNMDPSKIEDSITGNTSAIVPVHVFGNACYVEEIAGIARKYDLKVVYDAAHAFGVRYKGESLLGWGDISIVSFNSTKPFHTVEGGAMIIQDDELYKKAKRMINFGIAGLDEIREAGINARMNELEAAMGLCVLDEMERITRGRERVHNYYMEKLPSGIKYQQFQEGCSRNYIYFPVVFDSEETALRVRDRLEENQVRARRYFYPSLQNLPYIRENFDVPISNSISDRILCLPLYDALSLPDQDMIINVIKQAMR